MEHFSKFDLIAVVAFIIQQQLLNMIETNNIGAEEDEEDSVTTRIVKTGKLREQTA